MSTGRTLNPIPSFISVVVAVFLFFIVFGCMSNDAAAAERKSCVTSKCHANMGKEKYVHGPASVGQCTICHVLTAEHKFKPIENVGKICNECHEMEFMGKTTHLPVLKGECSGCHDPHQSPNEFMLRGAGENLCFICHEKKYMDGKFLHGPVAVGGCGIQPGVIVGATNDEGTEVADREVDAGHLFHTYLSAVDLDSSDSFDISGREQPMADPSACPRSARKLRPSSPLLPMVKARIRDSNSTPRE